MKRFRLAGTAKADVDRIWSYIAENGSIAAADRVVDRLTSRFGMLAGAPEAGRAVEMIEPGLRVFPVGNYLIYYRRDISGRVLIARVIHGRRDQGEAWEAGE